MKGIIALVVFVIWASSVTAQFSEVSVGFIGLGRGSTEWGDYDNDGDLDVLLTGSDPSQSLTLIYRNNGNNSFTLLTTGLPGVAYSSSAWGDYDNDGDLDILLSGLDFLTAMRISKVFRNDGNGVFTDIQANLINADDSSCAWGDFDNDGDLDILLTGNVSDSVGLVCEIYRNNGNSTFSNINAGLPGVHSARTEWGDYDNDGDLDILITGLGTTERVFKVFQNNGNGYFTIINIDSNYVGIPSECAWGDFDNDGDLDILWSGLSYTAPSITKIYRNNGNGSFTALTSSMQGVVAGDIVPGDYDNDGDLDFFIAGDFHPDDTNFVTIAGIYRNDGNFSFTYVNPGFLPMALCSAAWGDFDSDGDLDVLYAGWHYSVFHYTKLYRNDTTFPNSAPGAPTNLTISNNGDYLAIQWIPSSDSQTPLAGLNYSLKIGTTPGGGQIISPPSFSTGHRKVAAKGLLQGSSNARVAASRMVGQNAYYCSVQAIDGSYSGSSFSQEMLYQPLRIVYPNGGEAWGIGTVKTVVWYANPNISQIYLLLSLDHGNTWMYLNATPLAASMQAFTLTVPDPSFNSYHCLIKIVNAADYGIYDISDAPFIISWDYPSIPQNVHIYVYNDTCGLSWAPVTSTVLGNPVFVDFYNIYRNTSGDVNGTYTYLGYTSDFWYIDYNIGPTYNKVFYRVKAVDAW